MLAQEFQEKGAFFRLYALQAQGISQISLVFSNLSSWNCVIFTKTWSTPLIRKILFPFIAFVGISISPSIDTDTADHVIYDIDLRIRPFLDLWTGPEKMPQKPKKTL